MIQYFTAATIHCGCQKIRSIIRSLGIHDLVYSAGSTWTSKFIKKNSCLSCYLLSKFFHPPPFKKDFAHKVIINNKNNIRCQKNCNNSPLIHFKNTGQNKISYCFSGIFFQASFYLGYSYSKMMIC